MFGFQQIKYVFAVLVACIGCYVIVSLYNRQLEIKTLPVVIRRLFETRKSRILNESSPNAIENYYRYPCIQELDFNGTGPCARTVCEEPSCVQYVKCTSLPLKIIGNTKICTYNPAEDMIAGVIKRGGGWEDHLITHMMNILKQNPEMMLVDIGCNIGVYTLVAAWMSRRVICVDANYENIHMIHTSLALANLTENVTLVWNGLYLERKPMVLSVVRTNIGGSHLSHVGIVNDKISKRITAQSILLDDLEPLVRGKQVFMKMDVESNELNVIKGGSQFFKSVDVRYIQMEFTTPPTKVDIGRLLASHGFLLFKDIAGTERVDIRNQAGLPNGDVYFIKTSQILKD